MELVKLIGEKREVEVSNDLVKETFSVHKMGGTLQAGYRGEIPLFREAAVGCVPSVVDGKKVIARTVVEMFYAFPSENYFEAKRRYEGAKK